MDRGEKGKEQEYWRKLDGTRGGWNPKLVRERSLIEEGASPDKAYSNWVPPTKGKKEGGGKVGGEKSREGDQPKHTTTHLYQVDQAREQQLTARSDAREKKTKKTHNKKRAKKKNKGRSAVVP